MHYNHYMIRSFKDSISEDVFSGENVRSLAPEIQRRARRKLFAIDAAERLDDLRTPPGNRLHALRGDRAGQYAIRVNDQYRICFTFENGAADDVELCDYH